ncbi:MAG: glycoside hydrolase family 25 protein [Oscillospiraceae bacterium]|nr:glycoside hydrolase family 25 protein [Oscillospiraceae bacterium]
MKPIRRICLVLLVCALLFTGCSIFRRSRSGAAPSGSLIPRNTAEMTAFTKDENGVVSYPGAIQGIDVSSHQREIDWEAVYQDGIRFAILQIGFRGYHESGSLNVDSRFEENYENARAAGIAVGVYFYSQATSREEAKAEADFVLDTLGGRKLELPVFFDWEEVSRGRTAGYANTLVSDYAQIFCDTVAEGGYAPGVYFSQSYGYMLLNLEALRSSAFWLAEYGSYQSFGYGVHFWQYTGKGHVAGIEVQVDRDLMYVEPEAETVTEVAE